MPIFNFKRPPTGATEKPTALWLTPKTGKQLLQKPERQQLLDAIWELTSMSKSSFQTLYYAPVLRFAELVQELPASDAGHHAWLGGLLDHSLETMHQALRLRQSYLLPANAPPEEQACEAEAWSAAIAYGALLHDVGKPISSFLIELDNKQRWFPWQGSIQRPYRFRYIASASERTHTVSAALVAAQIVGVEQMNWLAGLPHLWRNFICLLSGHYSLAGQPGEILSQVLAGEQAISKPAQRPTPQGTGAVVLTSAKSTAAGESQEERWLAVIKKLIQEAKHEGQLNIAGGCAWLRHETLWLSTHAITHTFRTRLLQAGITIPANNTQLFDQLQNMHIIRATPGGRATWRIRVEENGQGVEHNCVRIKAALIWGDAHLPQAFSGRLTLLVNDKLKDLTVPVNKEQTTAVPVVDHSLNSHPFIGWLKSALTEKTLSVNDTRSKVHLVTGKAFIVTPDIFRRYCQDNPSTDDDNNEAWRRIQRAFEKLKLHQKRADDSNIWTCSVSGPGKPGRPLKGYVVDPKLFFETVPLNNPFLHLQN